MEEELTTFEKRQKVLEKRRLNILRVAAALLLAMSVGYLIYVSSLPAPRVTASKTGTATATATKDSGIKGAQPNRIYVSRLGIDEAVYLSPTGTVTQEDLLKGATFYNETTSKAGTGNCVIFGHSAVTSEHGAPFGAFGDNLGKVGDKIVLTDAANNKFTYVVDKIFEIPATDFSVVQPIPETETPVLTLITCIAPDYPKDKRLVIHAVLEK